MHTLEENLSSHYLNLFHRLSLASLEGDGDGEEDRGGRTKGKELKRKGKRDETEKYFVVHSSHPLCLMPRPSPDSSFSLLFSSSPIPSLSLSSHLFATQNEYHSLFNSSFSQPLSSLPITYNESLEENTPLSGFVAKLIDFSRKKTLHTRESVALLFPSLFYIILSFSLFSTWREKEGEIISKTDWGLSEGGRLIQFFYQILTLSSFGNLFTSIQSSLSSVRFHSLFLSFHLSFFDSFSWISG